MSAREYRVVWQREGQRISRRLYQSAQHAELWMRFITTTDGWREIVKNAYGPDFEGYWEKQEEERQAKRDLSPLVFAWIESREVGEWDEVAS